MRWQCSGEGVGGEVQKYYAHLAADWKVAGSGASSQKMGPVGISIVFLSVITFILGIVVIAVSGVLLDVVCARRLRLPTSPSLAKLVFQTWFMAS